ncbi:STAS domain-containing protein [Polynucleobacter sp. MWH-Loch1C5]|uniref:SulP family inorganic anion transporter n=1 Tax=Polynucleobacter sp. MWH-Loch1C5 TaxID=2689108 RepID=UPI001C0C1911|nr:SulP family inorganic anion transporter [Polynucleobacter sp. MWH-Loch1C5]MBU3542097.1 STAS domain-containing protein [Polynucleobacter sp. MWH-Loch1C5]
MISLARFHPKLIDALKNYDRASFIKDLSSGLTVGVIALPLAIAFAIASGMKPEAGLIAAVIGGFLISALGGSRVQIGGPAGAFVVIVYGIVERYGVANLILSTFLAGWLLLAMGLLRVGNLIRFIPVAIIIGFTSGIAVLIGVSQLRDALGLAIDKMPADFFAQWHTLWLHKDSFNPSALLVCLATVALIAVWPTINRRLSRLVPALTHVPGILIALVIMTLVSEFFKLPVETIADRFGEIPANIPSPSIPSFNWETAKQLFAPTLTIALLGAIESLLCARIGDQLCHDRHDPNQELMGQGIANIVVPFFGGLPVTGTIARTATNAKAGAKSPLAGMIHAGVILFIMLLAAPWASHIPMAVLAGILIFIAWNMFEAHEFKRLKHFNLTYRAILLGTFFLTIIFDLTVAVEVGLILACVFFIYRISSLTRIERLHLPAEFERADDLGLEQTPESEIRVEAYALYGSLFFGAIDRVENLEDAPSVPLNSPKVILLELHQLINIDTSGIESLKSLCQNLHLRGGSLIICGANQQPLSLMSRSGFTQIIGAENILPNMTAAQARLRQILAQMQEVQIKLGA